MFSAVGVVPNIGKPDKRIDFTNRREQRTQSLRRGIYSTTQHVNY
jgi:hypothetical protein